MNNFDSKSRRLFIELEREHFQIFSFSQNENNGDIYCSWPDIDSTIWVTPFGEIREPKDSASEPMKTSKLSIHKSGISVFRVLDQGEEIKQVLIKGSILLDKDNKQIGMRHLLTVFHQKPHWKNDASPLFNRQSDFVFRSKDEVKPFIIVFYAIPRHGVSIQFSFVANHDRFEKIPNDVILGLGSIPLLHHDIFWFAYTTKYLDWPKYNHVSNADGALLPLFFGKAKQEFELRIVQPYYAYSPENKELHMNILVDSEEMTNS